MNRYRLPLILTVLYTPSHDDRGRPSPVPTTICRLLCVLLRDVVCQEVGFHTRHRSKSLGPNIFKPFCLIQNKKSFPCIEKFFFFFHLNASVPPFVGLRKRGKDEILVVTMFFPTVCSIRPVV